MEVKIYAHGESDGNPGPATVELKIVGGSGETVSEIKEEIGNSTDAYAEYFAVLRGLQLALEVYEGKTADKKFAIYTNSELVEKHLNNKSPITEPALVPVFLEIHNLRVASFPNLTLTLV